MKILIIWPPHIPSYFNAGHHLPLFQVAEYIRENHKVKEVICIDAGALNYTWKEIADILSKNKFDIVAIMNDFDAVDTFERIVTYIRELSKHSKIITYGRLSKQIPGFFKKFDIDAISVSGDYEVCVNEFIELQYNTEINPKGLIYKDSSDIWKYGEAGEYLPSSEWKYPNLKEIPYDAYENMYINDRNKFCGIPFRRELVINVSRGCPVGCDFCDVPKMQGTIDRRVNYEELVNYIEFSFKEFNFEYISFYSPTFTLNREWTVNFCDLLISKGKKYSWKCVTTIQHLDKELIEKMSESGCIRISIGVETIDEKAKDALPIIKQNIKEKLITIVDICNKNNIEVNSFIILGLPNESVDGAIETIKFLESLDVRIRPTIYTPYNLMNNNMNLNEVNKFNRQLFVNSSLTEKEKDCLYNMFYSKEYKVTEVYNNIEKRK